MGIITIGIDQNGPFVSSLLHKELTMTPEEEQIMEHFIRLLKNEEPDIVLQVEQRSSSYVSLCKDMNDFLRVKWTDRSHWISVAVPSGHPEDDPLFAAQKNKKQRHWKAELRSLDELSAFDAIVLEVIK